MTFNPDDPKWTAYILGELEAPEHEAERTEIEGWIESSEEARAFMEELRVAAGALKNELHAELPRELQAAEGLTEEQRATVHAAAEMGQVRWFRRQTAAQTSAWLAGLAVAAMILIAVAMPSLWKPKQTTLTADGTEPKLNIAVTPAVPADADSKSEAATGNTVVVERSVQSQPAGAAPAKRDAAETVRILPISPETATASVNPSKSETATAIQLFPAPVVVAPSQARIGGGNGTSFAANGSIGGTITDASHALIPGVTVTLTNIATGTVDTRLTNDSGAFQFPSVSPGTYHLSASLGGFQTAMASNITIGPSAQVRQNLAMQIGNGAGAIAQLSIPAVSRINETSSSVGEVLDKDRISNLPVVGNNVLDLLTVLPGFRESAAGTGFDTVGGLGLNAANSTTNGASSSTAKSGSPQAGSFSTTVINPDLVGEARLVLPPVETDQGRVNPAVVGARGGGGRGGAAARGAPAGGATAGPGQGGGLAPGQGQGQGQGQAQIAEYPGGVLGGVVSGVPGRVYAGPPPPPAAPAVRAYSDNIPGFGYDNFGRPVNPGNASNGSYDAITDNPFIRVSQDPLSTFSSDVDTASYSNLRRFLNQNQLPPRDAVRIEEMVNYFNYDYAQPTGRDPIGAQMEMASAPWNPSHRLVRIGIKARDIDTRRKAASNLVFLIDVSGSMQPPERLPLIRSGLKMLTENLTENDHVSIVVYAGASGIALPSTSGNRKDIINAALDRLEAGGSTNGSAGIQLAYQLAASSFIPGGVNRVILATDGDFNVGVQNQNDLVRMIQDRAKTGVFLSVLGVGTDNLKDSTMKKLADNGNGNYAYIDSLNEAHKVLVEQMGGTLVTVAKDVKLQVEFNPNFVEAYRLIGYENRLLAAADFNNDRKDAGDMGAGHTVTALYEIVPRGGSIPGPGVDPLKYQTPASAPAPIVRNNSNETLTLKIRYKDPNGTESKLLSVPLVDREGTFSKASADFRFAASVAEFGMILRDSPYRGNASTAEVLDNAQASRNPDRNGYRQEFIGLVQRARSISGLR